jgi:hypothetical protein
MKLDLYDTIPEEYQEKVREINRYILKENFSNEELARAYFIAMGMPISEIGTSENLRESVFAIAQKFADVMKEGLSVSAVLCIIKIKELHEKAVDEFSKLIKELLISEEEKEILKSIVIEKKKGILSLCGYYGDYLAQYELSWESEHTKNDVAYTLYTLLDDFRDYQISLTFKQI